MHPSIGVVDEHAVVGAFLQALGRGEEAKHVMSLYWKQRGVLRVVRAPPVATSTGKVLHLHRLPAETASEPRPNPKWGGSDDAR